MMWREDLLLFAHRVVQSHCHWSPRIIATISQYRYFYSLHPTVASSETRLIAVSVHNLALKRAMMFLRLFPFSCTRWVLAQLIVSVFNFLPSVYIKPWNMLNAESPFTNYTTCNLFVMWIAAGEKFGCMRASKMWFIILPLVDEINRWIKDPEEKWAKIIFRANVILDRIFK